MYIKYYSFKTTGKYTFHKLLFNGKHLNKTI